MIVEIHFFLDVDNGIHNVIRYNYTYSNTNNKIFISAHILVSIS